MPWPCGQAAPGPTLPSRSTWATTPPTARSGSANDTRQDGRPRSHPAPTRSVVTTPWNPSPAVRSLRPGVERLSTACIGVSCSFQLTGPGVNALDERSRTATRTTEHVLRGHFPGRAPPTQSCQTTSIRQASRRTTSSTQATSGSAPVVQSGPSARALSEEGDAVDGVSGRAPAAKLRLPGLTRRDRPRNRELT